MTKLRTALAALAASALLMIGFSAPAHAALPPHTGVVVKGMPGVAPYVKAKAGAKLSPTYYFYAYGNQTVANTGVVANLRVESPYLQAMDYHSLAELDVEASTGPGGTRQIVELGWTKDVAQFGDSNPHLFAGCWINGVFQGYNTGCGYIDEVSNPINLGASLAGAVGTAKSFQILYASNAWWVAYNGSWVGRFLASSWTSPTFTQAAKYQAFGEVAAVTPTPCTDMGNGLQGSTFNAAPLAGYVASAAYYDTAGVGQSTLTNLTFGATDNTKYSKGPVPAATSPFYTRSGGISGPGWNAAGTATGTAGAC